MFTGLLNEYVIHCMLAAVAGVMVLICLKELIPKCLEVRTDSVSVCRVCKNVRAACVCLL